MITKISDIKTMRNGAVIDSFSGRIKKVYEQKTDVGQYGQWWLQNLTVEDDTGEVTVTWTGEDPFFGDQEGETRLFESSEGKKGLAGLKWEIRQKNGKTYESVKMDDRCKIKPLSSGDNGGSDQMGGAPTSQTTERRPEPPAHSSNGGVDEARRHIMMSANLYVLCVNAVNSYVAKHLPEVAQTSEMFQAATGTLFIEASRAGFVSKMPAKPVS